jgi:hypothetical protein
MKYGHMLQQRRRRKRRKSQNTTYCMIPFIWYVQNGQIHADKKDVSGWLELGGNGRKGLVADEYAVSFWDDENVLKIDCDVCKTQ